MRPAWALPASEALQYEYLQTPVDPGATCQVAFCASSAGHVLKSWPSAGCAWSPGFDLSHPQRPAAVRFGFSVAGGRIQGHVDGVLNGGPAELGMSYPALWECKTMNDKSWRDTVKHGVSK